ncbi:hypothetical protein FC83_GL000238 [Agrilactobacillus composti DSM 18527 = JCM 14202]|uniref:Reverse transcriptase domain-containing protein n=1 Tax=Agrilactobacillus composti DSM 18527 = JCM 14202 TaxID=1423734 RepID=X0PRZ8_9LACO|nr:reverse transcriptase/maturase family protein [Agrilactobacillus composti]KRM32834.1 hypothetical protein FC83_GL000238 [Agrilactobacillus composti DSM 18527 = JCM 14202]GAF40642.1 hypothetical protein JCM14202_2548 [Agrilactobacillus composti DSM 18527 = JCM 14202]
MQIDTGIKALLTASQKKYTHFDFPVPEIEKERLIKELRSDLFTHHRYLPLISFRIKIKKYKASEQRVLIKERNISLPSHHDTLVYRFFGAILNQQYSIFAKAHGIDEVAVAYREKGHGSNIIVARDVINTIVDNKESWIIKGDFKSFFDTLDHKKLEQELVNILGNPLTPEWRSMLKAITKYRMISQRRLHAQLKVAGLRMSHRKYGTAYVKDLKTLGKLIRDKKIRLSRINQRGIPQGTAVSAVLANVYMGTFDQILSRKVSNMGGIYRRYSDDFVVVLPKGRINFQSVIELKKLIISFSVTKLGLEISSEKTKLYEYRGINKDIRVWNGSSWGKMAFDYLGFIFDGYSVSLRSKSIYKFIYRGKRAVNDLITLETDRQHISSRDDIDMLVENYKKKRYKYKTGIEHSWRSAFPYERKRLKIRLENAKQIKDSTHYKLHKAITIRYLASVPKKDRQSMLGYAKKAQQKFDEISHPYHVVIYRQVMRQIKRNQKRLGKSRGKNV